MLALDPAGPAFYTGNLARTINKEDGQFVDAIHTNAGQLGIWQNVGQVDFYMNGGSGPQPGCYDLDSASSVLKAVASTVVGESDRITRRINKGIQFELAVQGHAVTVWLPSFMAKRSWRD